MMMMMMMMMMMNDDGLIPESTQDKTAVSFPAKPV